MLPGTEVVPTVEEGACWTSGCVHSAMCVSPLLARVHSKRECKDLRISPNTATTAGNARLMPGVLIGEWPC